MKNKIIAVFAMIAVMLCVLSGIAVAKKARGPAAGGGETISNKLSDKQPASYVPTAEEKAACDAWRQGMIDKQKEKSNGVLGPFGSSGGGSGPT